MLYFTHFTKIKKTLQHLNQIFPYLSLFQFQIFTFPSPFFNFRFSLTSCLYQFDFSSSLSPPISLHQPISLFAEDSSLTEAKSIIEDTNDLPPFQTLESKEERVLPFVLLNSCTFI
ncbi:hypothetical protein MtrunA17_Chr5g0421661 [Medicago truncatula]|uniref:Uncharacterized protein n=1 Tax=Medicago truncatula TaxID=3880 RepID=A0A396HR01_MEDTR|nr:hypothetical protein MtrunA17_Chr5g0421661 [Medicago truncatula]